MTTPTRRKFLTATAVGAAAAPLATPAIAQSTIKWRMQTYAGPALAAHVIDPAIEMFNKIAGDRMQIELFYADQLVPTGELFRAMQKGTIDAVQSDDDSMASPTDVTVFGVATLAIRSCRVNLLEYSDHESSHYLELYQVN